MKLEEKIEKIEEEEYFKVTRAYQVEFNVPYVLNIYPLPKMDLS